MKHNLFSNKNSTLLTQKPSFYQEAIALFKLLCRQLWYLLQGAFLFDMWLLCSVSFEAHYKY